MEAWVSALGWKGFHRQRSSLVLKSGDSNRQDSGGIYITLLRSKGGEEMVTRFNAERSRRLRKPQI